MCGQTTGIFFLHKIQIINLIIVLFSFQKIQSIRMKWIASINKQINTENLEKIEIDQEFKDLAINENGKNRTLQDIFGSCSYFYQDIEFAYF